MHPEHAADDRCHGIQCHVELELLVPALVKEVVQRHLELLATLQLSELLAPLVEVAGVVVVDLLPRLADRLPLAL
eukprot:3121583-Heterocapsa_arctica.AAC.1